MKLEEIFKEDFSEEEASFKKYEASGVYIYSNPEDFLEVMEHLQKAYLGADEYE